MDPTSKLTLEDLLKNFRKGYESLCWYVEGKHLEFPVPYGVSRIKTFVLVHKSGEVFVGYMGYCNSALTFINIKNFYSVFKFKLRFPQLLGISGLLYSL